MTPTSIAFEVECYTTMATVNKLAVSLDYKHVVVVVVVVTLTHIIKSVVTGQDPVILE